MLKATTRAERRSGREGPLSGLDADRVRDQTRDNGADGETDIAPQPVDPDCGPPGRVPDVAGPQ
jgi:hypothetical protein